MKTFRTLLNNKTGIVFAGVHWIFLLATLFALIRILPFDHGRGSVEPSWEPYLIPVIMSDLPALIIAAILWSPFYLFFEDKTTFWFGTLLTSILTNTFQWLFIGKVINNTFNPSESKPTSLSLTDE